MIVESEAEKNELLQIVKLEKDKTKEKFFDIIRPLQQRYAETKDKRKEIGQDSDGEDEEVFSRTLMVDLA